MKKSLKLMGFLCLTIMFAFGFSSCEKEVMVPNVQDQTVSPKDNIVSNNDMKSYWVDQSWNFNVFDLSESFNVSNLAIVVGIQNTSSATLTIEVQERTGTTGLNVHTCNVNANDLGTIAIGSPHPQTDNILVTVFRTGGSLFPTGTILVKTQYPWTSIHNYESPKLFFGLFSFYITILPWNY